MSQIATMKVTYISSPDGGLVTINQCDFDPKLHIAEGEKKPAKRGRPRKQSESK